MIGRADSLRSKADSAFEMNLLFNAFLAIFFEFGSQVWCLKMLQGWYFSLSNLQEAWNDASFEYTMWADNKKVSVVDFAFSTDRDDRLSLRCRSNPRARVLIPPQKQKATSPDGEIAFRSGEGGIDSLRSPFGKVNADFSSRPRRPDVKKTKKLPGFPKGFLAAERVGLTRCFASRPKGQQRYRVLSQCLTALVEPTP